MAKPAPCQACLETPDAEFYVTNRLDVPWPFDQPTVALCYRCFISLGLQLGQAIEAALASLGEMAADAPETAAEAGPAPEGTLAPPEAVAGILEAVEREERLGVIPARERKSRSHKAAATVDVQEPATAPEGQAAHDQG